MGLFFLKHPGANVRCAIHHLDALRLALIQEANSVDVDNVDLIEVQSRRMAGKLDFSAKTDELRTSKLTGQTNSSPVILTKRLDSQRHSWHPHLPMRDARRGPLKKHSAPKGWRRRDSPDFEILRLVGKTRKECPYFQQRWQHQRAWDLNRYLSMPRRFIFASSVEPGMPSLAAAPVAPEIRP